MSTLKVNTLEEATAGGATFFTAKAWATFNGQGTVSITVSAGVSSITDNGTGIYTLNLSNSTTTAYQVICGSASGVVNVSYDGAAAGRNKALSNATSNVPCYLARNAGSSTGPAYDSPEAHVVIVA